MNNITLLDNQVVVWCLTQWLQLGQLMIIGHKKELCMSSNDQDIRE